MSTLILNDVDNLIHTFENQEYIDEGRLKTILKGVGFPAAVIFAEKIASDSIAGSISISTAGPVTFPALFIALLVLNYALLGYSANKIYELITFGKFTDEVRNIQKKLDKAPPGTKEHLKELYDESKQQLKSCETAECNAKVLKVFIENVKKSKELPNYLKKDILENVDVILGKSEKLVKKAKKDS